MRMKSEPGRSVGGFRRPKASGLDNCKCPSKRYMPGLAPNSLGPQARA